MVIPSLAAVGDYVGKDIGCSEWVTIAQDQIDAFAEATGDHQWIHVDVERARRESPFRQTVAHGYLVLSLAPALMEQVGRIEGCSSVINVGFDKVRLKQPVPAGARVRMHVRVKAVRDVPRGGRRVVYVLSFEVEGVPKRACIAEAILIYYP
ncbi:MAG: MaoC family dehydratase [Deltaproteobacteria bacterium]|nr:MAG: MaoC family dehydratase [Deltaproteobacteria bacterium]